MIKRFGHYLLNNPWQAGLFAMVFGFIPLLGLISTLILGLITLRLGPKRGLWILWWSCIPSITLALVGYPEALIFGIGSKVYFWIIACILRYAISWGIVLESSVVLGVITIIAVHLCWPGVDLYWLEKYQMTLNDMTKELHNNLGSATDDTLANIAELTKWLTPLSKVTTGILTTFILLGNIINLGVSRWWQAQLFNPQGFREEISQMRIGYVTSAGFILVLLLASLTDINLFIDITPVFIGVFFLAGLSMLHFVFGKIKSGTFLLIVLYLSLVVFPQIVFFLVVAAALLDSLLNVRQRLKLAH